MKNIKKIAQLITLLIIIICSIVLFTISLELFNTFIDNILDNIKNNNCNYNYDFNYNMLHMENSISDDKNKGNPNIFLSKINKIVEYSKLINIDMFSYIKKQDIYNPSTIKTVFYILAEDKNFDITNIKDSDIRENIFNQRNFKLGISNKLKRFIGCNEIEAEIFRFLYENKKEYLEKYNFLEQLKKDKNNMYHKFIKFINHIENHYVLSIEGKNFRLTNYNSYYMELIDEIYKNNYITYPYITQEDNLATQIVIPQFRNFESNLNLKYESYKEIEDNIKKLEDKFKLLNEINSIRNENKVIKYENSLIEDEHKIANCKNSLITNENNLITDENKIIKNEINLRTDKNELIKDESKVSIDEKNLITDINKDIKYKDENTFKIKTLSNREIPFINENMLTYNPDNLGNLDDLNEKIKTEKKKKDQIENILEYIKNKKIDYIVENNLNNEGLTLKETNKSIAYKAIENSKKR